MSAESPATTSIASAASGARKRVFSGVQPSGNLHLGNYLGALAQWVAMQEHYENVFCVVDLHAITVPEAVEPAVLRAKTREVAALYMACGIDLDKSTIFCQSHIHQHAELAWVLNCVTPTGWLERMTQYKSKSQRVKSIGTGLLVYPVLQAADILLYDTHIVPVGEDQRQHIELARDVALRFNNLFGEVFVVPEVTIRPSGARVMGLDDPEAKMSKSLGAEKKGHAIGLLDDEKSIGKAVMSAVTDSGRETRFEHAKAGVLNLLTIYEALTGEPRPAIEARFEGKGYGELKKGVLEAALDHIRPVQAKYKELTADPGYIDRVLSEGAARVRPLAERVMQRVKDAVGLG